MSMDGIGRLCEDIGVDPENVAALVLCWRLGSKSKPGAITREEFIEGMTKNRQEGLESLRNMVPSLDIGFLERSEFRGFYRFAFKFSLEGTHKTIETELVINLLPIVLNDTIAPHLPDFLAFLKQSSNTRITLDQWESFLQFSQSVSLDVSDFDEDGAWPILLDEFVEWKRSEISKTT
jgi:hypothetical protein